MSRKATLPIWEVADEVPRAGLPDEVRLNRRAKWYRRWILASLVLLPVALLALIITVGNTASADKAPPPATLSSHTRAAATVAVERWLGSKPAPLPGGHIVAWEKATTTSVQHEPSQAEKQGPPVTTELHTFTLASPDGLLFTSQVTTASSPAYGVKVLTTPSLVPVAATGDSFPDTPLWPGLEDAPSSPEVEAAVNQWAAAYTSGDPQLLRQVVQDPDRDHAYVPLAGAAFTTVQVGDVGAIWGKDQTDRDGDVYPDTVVVNVTATIRWAGAQTKTDDEPASTSYDLLVSKANTAAPTVVAWGGSGTGETLQPYANAVTGRTVTAVTPTPDPQEQSQQERQAEQAPRKTARQKGTS